jgi:hypothetical protein
VARRGSRGAGRRPRPRRARVHRGEPSLLLGHQRGLGSARRRRRSLVDATIWHPGASCH